MLNDSVQYKAHISTMHSEHLAALVKRNRVVQPLVIWNGTSNNLNFTNYNADNFADPRFASFSLARSAHVESLSKLNHFQLSTLFSYLQFLVCLPTETSYWPETYLYRMFQFLFYLGCGFLTPKQEKSANKYARIGLTIIIAWMFRLNLAPFILILR